MPRYLLTGAAGFIASRVADFLLDEGHTVVALDNLNDAYDVRLKKWRLERLLGRAGFTFHRGDIADRAAVMSAAGAHEFDAVINLAARAGVRYSTVDPWVYVSTNVTGTLNLLELCRERKIPKFLLASTSSLYGGSNPIPFGEDQNTDHPLSPYAASKKGAEAMCFTYHHLYGIDTTVVRYFTVYGPAGRPDMALFRFVQWISEEREVLIYGDGKQRRDFTYVDDIARGSILGLKALGYQTINLGADEPVELMRTVNLIEDAVGKKARLKFLPAHPADVPATWADVRRAREKLGWKATVGYEEGIRRLVEWYRENRAWAKEIDTH